MELYNCFCYEGSSLSSKEEIQNYLMFLLNVSQHDAENDENLTNDDYDLVSENESESGKV